MSTETQKPSSAHWRTTLRRLGACPEGIAYALTQPDIETAWHECNDARFLMWLALRLPSPTDAIIDAHNSAVAYLNGRPSLVGKRAVISYRKRVPWALVAPAFRAAQREHSKSYRRPLKPTEATPAAQPSAPAAREPGFIADSDLPGDVACDDCGFYSTEVLGECEKCHGDGHSVCSECKGAEGVECESCKGARRVFCADCHGTGEAPEPEHISNSNGCDECEDMREHVAADASHLWRRDLGRNVTNGTAALYVKFAVSDYRAALVAKAEREAA